MEFLNILKSILISRSYKFCENDENFFIESKSTDFGSILKMFFASICSQNYFMPKTVLNVDISTSGGETAIIYFQTLLNWHFFSHQKDQNTQILSKLKNVYDRFSDCLFKSIFQYFYVSDPKSISNCSVAHLQIPEFINK